eukprot:4815496-Amphidinium_carterae.1
MKNSVATTGLTTMSKICTAVLNLRGEAVRNSLPASLSGSMRPQASMETTGPQCSILRCLPMHRNHWAA